MRVPTTARLAGVLGGCLLTAVASAQEGITPLKTPAPDGSGMYSLNASPEGATFLSWVEPAGDGHVLRFSELQRPGSSEEVTEDTWGEPKLIAEGSGWFANWADHPSIALVGENRLAAHYLVRNPAAAGHYGYGLKIVFSMDRGVTWREVFSEGARQRRELFGVRLLHAGARRFLGGLPHPASGLQGSGRHDAAPRPVP